MCAMFIKIKEMKYFWLGLNGGYKTFISINFFHGIILSYETTMYEKHKNLL